MKKIGVQVIAYAVWYRPMIEVFNFYCQTRDWAEFERQRLHKHLSGMTPEDPTFHETKERHEFFTRYPYYLRNASFLMLFSLLEEGLLAAYTPVKRRGEKCAGGTGIERFKNLYKGVGIKLCLFKDWEFLVACQKVRDALLHANASISIVKEEKQRELLILMQDHRWKGHFVATDAAFLFHDKNKRLVVEEPALDRLMNQGSALLQWIAERAGPDADLSPTTPPACTAPSQGDASRVAPTALSPAEQP